MNLWRSFLSPPSSCSLRLATRSSALDPSMASMAVTHAGTSGSRAVDAAKSRLAAGRVPPALAIEVPRVPTVTPHNRLNRGQDNIGQASTRQQWQWHSTPKARIDYDACGTPRDICIGAGAPPDLPAEMGWR
jgi:hypothetical protein